MSCVMSKTAIHCIPLERHVLRILALLLLTFLVGLLWDRFGTFAG